MTQLPSTNINENINSMVSTKVSTRNMILSLDYREAAAVSQKNDGHGYVVTVNKICIFLKLFAISLFNSVRENSNFTNNVLTLTIMLSKLLYVLFYNDDFCRSSS